jgi:ankyrin repeat protein
MVAAFSDQPLVIDCLCRNGADINARNPYGATALIYAAYCGRLEATKALLKYNPDRTIKGKFNQTALNYAESYSFTGIAALLKEP